MAEPSIEPPRDVSLRAIADRLRRAQEHLDAIKGELVAYYENDACSLAGEFHTNDDGPGRGAWTVGLAPLGPRLNTLIGEFLHDCRSLLNHLARQLVLEHTGEATRRSEFPVFSRAPTAKKKGKEALPDIPGSASPDARRLLHLFQPYSWGDRYREHPIWVLDKLWNIDKHRDVLARGGYVQAHFLGEDIPDFSYTSRFDSATPYEAKLILVPDDPDMDVNAYATVKVSLSEPELVADIQLLGALEQILKTVKEFVSAALDVCFLNVSPGVDAP